MAERVKAGAKPSMIDVARQAGVSHQTVSRVLNVPDAVLPDTRDRVQRAMRELGYRRNNQARALKTRSAGLVGVVSQGSDAFGPTRMTLAIEEAARDRGFSTALSVVRDADPDTVDSTLELFLSHGIDGIVVVTPVPTLAAAAARLSLTTPVVLVTSGLQPAENMAVAGIDQVLGAQRAVQYFIDQGHRRIAHVAGPLDWYDARGRVTGWEQTLTDAGLEVPPVVRAAEWTAEAGYRAATELFDRAELPEAVFASNDFLALGLIRALEERNVKVPDDISVIGFDDVDASSYFSPPLTTVRQPFGEAGRAALELLLDNNRNPVEAPSFIAPELVVRGSTAPPSSRL